MSINANISFEIHNIKAIHNPKDEVKRGEICDAAEKFLEEEGLMSQDIIIDFEGQDGNLVAYSTCEIIIPGSNDWAMAINEKWRALAVRVLGPSCKPHINIEFPDAERENFSQTEQIPAEKVTTVSESPTKKPWWKFW